MIALVETPHFCQVHIDKIIVEDRHRYDLGDIKSLAESIESIGLIHNVVVTPDNHLIAGARRLAAMRSLGWDMIPTAVIHTLADATDRLLAERDENTCRKDFVPSELLAIGRRLEELERPKAEERQREGARLGGLAQGERLSSAEDNLGKPTNRIVGEALGVSQSTYERIKVVDNATRDADPAVAVIAQQEMAKLDAGETTPNAASNAIRNARNGVAPIELIETAEPEVIPDLPSKPKGGHRPNHLKILTNVTNTLSGFVMVLEEIEEINNTVNDEEASRIRADLSRQIRALNRIRNLLKEV
jgi:ParB-like chromosome segregation protein Spo0J